MVNLAFKSICPDDDYIKVHVCVQEGLPAVGIVLKAHVAYKATVFMKALGHCLYAKGCPNYFATTLFL